MTKPNAKFSPPSDGEWAILETLWAIGPTTASRVTEEVESTREWAYSTVKTMLDRMARKGLVKARRVGSVWEYTAAVAPDNARMTAWRRFVDSVFGGAMSPALRFIAEDAHLSPAEREELRVWLEKSNEREG